MATSITHSPPWYEPVDPPRDLGSLLACSWTARPTGRHRLTPDGCVELLWLSAGGLRVCGPETASWQFELPRHVTAVGVRFRPGAAAVVFDLPVSSITDRVVPLGSIVGSHAAAVLDRRLGAHATGAAARDDLVAWVRELAGHVRHNDPFAEEVLQRLAASPRAGQRELASAVGLSVRQLHRRALRSFGYGTATLARLLRFQRFLAVVTAGAGTGDGSHRAALGSAAADAGYADQAHLAHDCRAITGLTPTRFLAEWFPTFPDMSDPYKTDEWAAARMGA